MFSIHHISLSVTSLDTSVNFYQKLGFKEVLRWKADDGSLQISHLKLGEVFLELFSFKKFVEAPSSTKKLDTDLMRIGVKHFGIKVRSIIEAKDWVEKNNIAQNVEIKHGRTNIDYFFIQDPDGIFIEFVQDDRGL